MFDFTDEDGEECTESWDRSDGVPLREHLDEIVDIHFGDASEEVRGKHSAGKPSNHSSTMLW
jgi:hypothetical protein